MNDELGATWKEAVVAYFKVLFQHMPSCTDESTVKLGHYNKTQDLPNMKQEYKQPNCDIQLVSFMYRDQ
jgi:hypothetical protein